MSLTAEEQAQLEALTAKAAEQDGDSPAEVAGDVAAEVGSAVADAVGEVAETVASVVAHTVADAHEQASRAVVEQVHEQAAEEVAEAEAEQHAAEQVADLALAVVTEMADQLEEVEQLEAAPAVALEVSGDVEALDVDTEPEPTRDEQPPSPQRRHGRFASWYLGTNR